MRRYKKVYVEITNVCNLTCEFCPKTKRAPGFMSVQQFEQVIREIRPYTDYVYFHLMGEPFLHPHLAEFLNICSKNALKVNLTTNGTLISEVRSVLLSSDVVHKVNFSLHSFEANEYEEGLEKYLFDIASFAQTASQQYGIINVLRLWNEDSAALKASNSRNGEILDTLTMLLQPEFDIAQRLREKRSVTLAPFLYLERAEKFSWPDAERPVVSQRMFCHGLRDQFGVLVDGTVVPCCLDSEGSIVLGNLFAQPLTEILTAPRACAVYDGFSGRYAVEPLCKRCGYAVRY